MRFIIPAAALFGFVSVPAALAASPPSITVITPFANYGSPTGAQLPGGFATGYPPGARTCVTASSSCAASAPNTVGNSCTCPTPNGTASGTVR
jgi:hypothetical protein